MSLLSPVLSDGESTHILLTNILPGSVTFGDFSAVVCLLTEIFIEHAILAQLFDSQATIVASSPLSGLELLRGREEREAGEQDQQGRPQVGHLEQRTRQTQL